MSRHISEIDADMDRLKDRLSKERSRRPQEKAEEVDMKREGDSMRGRQFYPGDRVLYASRVGVVKRPAPRLPDHWAVEFTDSQTGEYEVVADRVVVDLPGEKLALVRRAGAA